MKKKNNNKWTNEKENAMFSSLAHEHKHNNKYITIAYDDNTIFIKLHLQLSVRH